MGTTSIPMTKCLYLSEVSRTVFRYRRARTIKPIDLFDAQEKVSTERRFMLPESKIVCPSCKKRVEGYGRYCIQCGSILKPVYCSRCGTPNPNDLDQCLECGNPIPNLTDIRWSPIVTVIQPTSAMIDEESHAPALEVIPSNLLEPRKGLFSRLRARLDRREQLAD